MSQIYSFTGLVAMMLASLGSAIFAFWFCGSRKRELTAQVASLRRMLRERLNEAAEARQEISNASAQVRLLEQQMLRRNREMEFLQQTVQRQKRALTLLQSDADAMRLTLALYQAATADHSFSASRELPHTEPQQDGTVCNPVKPWAPEDAESPVTPPWRMPAEMPDTLEGTGKEP
jgi:hypothetical protein